jgi:DMSO/TMAO reductase YedYZ molybdopterin-dependent catalytic subunit
MIRGSDATVSDIMQPLASRSADIAAAAAGAIAAAVTIAVGELLAGLVAGAPSLVIAIGDLVIDLQPPGAKDLMVSLFGDADKAVLNVMIVVGALLIAAGIGVAARRRWPYGVVGFLVAGGVAAVAAVRQPLTDRVLAVLTIVVSVAVGLTVLRWLLSMTRPAWGSTPGHATVEGPATDTDASAGMPDWDRRRFLIAGGSAAAGAVVAGSVGRALLEGRAGGPRVGDVLPPVSVGGSPAPGPSLPAGTELDVEGITPLVVPNDRFYRIDTALIVPRVDTATWTLRVRGMVDHEVSLSYEQLRSLPLFEQYVTIACVSNEVGGRLVGNALWRGVHLREVLAMAGVQEGASQIVGRSVDGFTVGFPTSWAMDPSRDPMIAIGMNGEPLPVDHGYPARLIIPGLFGYVSATKWLGEIELTTWDAFDAYWVPLGWAKEGPILTQSRIDVPRSGATLAVGPVTIAGVAWAPDRGIEAVDVRIDDGDWMPATLSVPLSDATWVQWLVAWDATPGGHRIAVRATDGTGEVQTEERTSPAPDGARGHHGIEVRVA